MPKYHNAKMDLEPFLIAQLLRNRALQPLTRLSGSATMGLSGGLIIQPEYDPATTRKLI